MTESTAYAADMPAILSDGLGGCYVAWRDLRNFYTSETDVYMQHLTADGEIAPGWPEGALPVLTAPGSLMSEILLVPDETGGVYVVWSDNRNRLHLPGTTGTGDDIYALRVLANGALGPGWPINGLVVCGAAGNQNYPSACADGEGGFFVVWEDERDPGSPEAIYAQRVSSDGNLLWGVPGAPVNVVSNRALRPKITGDGQGGAFIAWEDSRQAGEFDVYGLRLRETGSPHPNWTANGVALCSAAGPQGAVALAPDRQGGVYVGWRDLRSAPGTDPYSEWYSDIYMARFESSGQLAPGWPADGLPICTAPEIQTALRMEPDGAGGALMAWSDYRGPAISIYAQRVLADGSVAPGWAPGGTPVSTAPEFQLDFRLARDGLGGAFVSFEMGIETGSAAYIQHLTAEGAVAPGFEGIGLTIPTGYGQQNSVVAYSRPGVAIMAWVDGRKFIDGFSYPEMYALPFGVDPPTAVTVSLQSATVEPGLAKLSWLVTGAASLRATVERRTEAMEWTALATVIADGSGRIAHDDATVEPGGRYAYRLRYTDGDAEATTPEAWLEIPARYELALAGFRPNPATRGDLTVAFTLPDAAAASLELLDVAGRRVASRDVGALGAGRHVVRLDADRGIATGVYWVRLVHPSRSLTGKAIIVD